MSPTQTVKANQRQEDLNFAFKVGNLDFNQHSQEKLCSILRIYFLNFQDLRPLRGLGVSVLIYSKRIGTNRQSRAIKPTTQNWRTICC